MRQTLLSVTMAALVSLSSASAIDSFAQSAQSPVRQIVDGIVIPWIAKNNLPGAAVAISLAGKETFYFYGHRDDAGNPFRPR
jgi:hypothetical protein